MLVLPAGSGEWCHLSAEPIRVGVQVRGATHTPRGPQEWVLERRGGDRSLDRWAPSPCDARRPNGSSRSFELELRLGRDLSLTGCWLRFQLLTVGYGESLPWPLPCLYSHPVLQVTGLEVVPGGSGPGQVQWGMSPKGVRSSHWAPAGLRLLLTCMV